MEQLELSRFQITGLLGSGADYEVRAAVDQETGKQVVLKRPVPQMVSRGLHGGTETRTDRILEFHQRMERPIDTLIPIVGYTERAVHPLMELEDAVGPGFSPAVQPPADHLGHGPFQNHLLAGLLVHRGPDLVVSSGTQ